MQGNLGDESSRCGLRQLAEQARAGDAAAAEEFRRRAAESLGPIVRLALRRGGGPAPVVNWVRRAHAQVGVGAAAPADQYAPAIAQLLGAALLRGPVVG